MKRRFRLAMTLAVLGVFVLLLAGCGGTVNAGSETADASQVNDGQRLPFDGNHSGQDKPGLIERGKRMLGTRDTDRITIAAGTPIPVRLQHGISSATAASGQSFEAVLAEPLVVNGKTVAPRYANVRGRVVAARKSGRLHNAGYLRLALDSVEINGRMVPVETSSIYAQGGSHKKRNLGFIGGGAAGGAVIGALAGGGKGALIGSAIGAGAGTTAAYATGKKDVGFAAERRLTFRLTQPLAVN